MVGGGGLQRATTARGKTAKSQGRRNLPLASGTRGEGRKRTALSVERTRPLRKRDGSGKERTCPWPLQASWGGCSMSAHGASGVLSTQTGGSAATARTKRTQAAGASSKLSVVKWH